MLQRLRAREMRVHGCDWPEIDEPTLEYIVNQAWDKQITFFCRPIFYLQKAFPRDTLVFVSGVDPTGGGALSRDASSCVNRSPALALLLLARDQTVVNHPQRRPTLALSIFPVPHKSAF